MRTDDDGLGDMVVGAAELALDLLPERPTLRRAAAPRHVAARPAGAVPCRRPVSGLRHGAVALGCAGLGAIGLPYVVLLPYWAPMAVATCVTWLIVSSLAGWHGVALAHRGRALLGLLLCALVAADSGLAGEPLPSVLPFEVLGSLLHLGIAWHVDNHLAG